MHSSATKSGKNWSAADYAAGILRGDRVVLGRAITLVESSRADHRDLADEVLERCLPYTGNSFRLGITGPPGVGKSSFIEAFGSSLVKDHGKKLAVLAIDPSSQVSGGSILGDKTRMERLSTDPNAFIRPSPSGKALGGVANCTHETMLLCEAAGFDTVFIETVGVGQSETAVAGMVDFFLLLLLPGAGDELQGIKRGIVEMADLLVVNKADGDRMDLAKAARQDYAHALHLFPLKENGWQPKALTCSALTGAGLDQIWQLMLDFQTQAKASGWFEQNRRNMALLDFDAKIKEAVWKRFLDLNPILEELSQLKAAITRKEIASSKAVELVLDKYMPR